MFGLLRHVHRVDGHLPVHAQRAARSARHGRQRLRSSAHPGVARSLPRVGVLYDGYWADVGTVDSYYDANIQLTQPNTPFSFYDPSCPIYTHERFLPPSRMLNSDLRNALVSDGSYLDQSIITDSVVGIRTIIRNGARIRGSVLLGADYYEQDTNGHSAHAVPLGIGPNVELDRVIVDKNARIGAGARLVNSKGVQEFDGDGFYIRNGIVIVPKDATI